MNVYIFLDLSLISTVGQILNWLNAVFTNDKRLQQILTVFVTLKGHSYEDSDIRPVLVKYRFLLRTLSCLSPFEENISMSATHCGLIVCRACFSHSLSDAYYPVHLSFFFPIC